MYQKPIKIGNLVIKLLPTVYPPSDDTFFLEDTLKKFAEKGRKPKTILEIGCGSGYITVILKKLFPQSMLLSLDINEDACELTKQNLLLNGFHPKQNPYQIIHADIFDFLDRKIYPEKLLFDLVVMNPPYLPGEPRSKIQDTIKIATIGGSTTGDEFINNFLTKIVQNQNQKKVTKRLLAKNAFLIMLIAEWNKKAKTLITNMNYFKIITVYKKKISFESLYAYLLTISTNTV